MTASLGSLFTSENPVSSSKESQSNSKGKLGKKQDTKLQKLFAESGSKEFVKPDVIVPDIAELRRLKEAKINPKKLNKKAKKRLISELKISDFGETSDHEDDTDTELVEENEDKALEHVAKKHRKVTSDNQNENDSNIASSDEDQSEEEEDSDNELEEALKELRETTGRGIDTNDLNDSETDAYEKQKTTIKQ